jgi:hypothetical protein
MHYLFVADDMIINPKINENNYCRFFNLDEETCFIPELRNIPRVATWSHHRDALHFNPFNKQATHLRGVEIIPFLPSKDNAAERMKKWGVQNTAISFKSVYGNFFERFLYKTKMLVEDIFLYRHLYPQKTHYPLTSSYADIFIVSANTIKQFSHFCGIFSASRLFVEIALPTALAFSANKISTEKDLSLDCQKYATPNADIQENIDRCNFDLGKLFDRFPENQMYIHPIKLSKWNTKNLFPC